MKTLEEKARAYDKALERARKLYNSEETSADVEIACENIFPELAESEDERIRIGLIGLFNDMEWGDSILHDYNMDKDKTIAWLEKQGNVNALIQEAAEKSYTEGMRVERKRWIEKQGEQKPTDKIESKFKVGDFIVNDYCFGKVIEITNDAYLLDTGQGIPFSYEHNAHLWTIQDAKPGDMLVGKIDGDNYILIFKQIKDGWIETYGHYYSAVDRFCIPSQLFCRYYEGTFYPATKEQCDTLMKAMADAGYTFDFDKKELKKIEQNLASSAKTCKNDALLDLLNKMPSCITVDGVDYYFVMRKTSFYTAYYKAIGEECSNNAIFALTAYSPIDLLTEMFKELKEEGLLE